jgi:superfamily II DNA or RNA helicase
MSPLCLPGSTVVVRDEQWRVAGIDAYERCSVITLEGSDRRRLRVIDPFDRVVAVDSRRIVRRPRNTVLRRAMAAVAGDRPAIGLWTAATATIDLLPYQLEPALAVLRGATRVLLADGVGLGKTIQAGLILSELRERGFVERALVLCPAGLRAGWALELQQRFGIPCGVIDQVAIADIGATLPPGVNPWTMHATVIASIDLVKRPEVMAALAAVPIDMVIADEAHHLTPGTDRGAAVDALASRAPWCVLATATPHSGDDAAFDYLARIGGHGDPLTIFRRSRQQAGLDSRRRERLFRMRPGAAEMTLLDEVRKYTQAIWRARGVTDRFAQLVAITIARRAASSPLALERTLRRRLTLLSPAAEPVQNDLPWDEEYDGDDCGAPALLARPGLQSEAAERTVIERLLHLIAGIDAAAKLRWIGRALLRLDEPAIVFTEYRDTVEAILAMLPPHIRPLTITGATPIDERRSAVESLNRGDADVLLATETAGEGLNLHYRCRLVIDVELPWSPLRLEQRIGRVDRLGQGRRVHAWRLLHAGTIETHVLECLQQRRHRAARLDQAGAIDEASVAAMVFGETSRQIPRAPAIASAVVPGVEAECARLMQQRRYAVAHQKERRAVGAPPQRRATTRMVALHSTTLINERGAIVADSSCAHLITVDGRGGWPRDVLERIATSESLQAAAGEFRDCTLSAVNANLAPLRQRVDARIAAIRRHLAASRTRAVQRSLFDGRGEQTATAHEAACDVLDAALARRSRSVIGTVAADASATRLIAAWPVTRR